MNIQAFAFQNGVSGLLSLNFTSATLNTLVPNGFSGLPLSTLDLTSKGITNIQPNAFAGMTLSTLLLGGNNMSIQTDAFASGCGSLSTLTLRGANLTTLLNATFNGITMTSLDLGKCGITTIQARAFFGLSLTSLNLTDNPNLNILPAAFAVGCSGLTNLFFGGSTTLPTLYTDGFQGLPPAIFPTFNLSSKSITSIQAYAFRYLNITVLDLSGNPNLVLTSNAFSEGLGLANSLLFGGTTTLGTINADVFNGMTTLSTLDLSSKSLTQLKGNAFRGLPALTTLDLSNNPSLSIQTFAFTGLGQVTTLTIGGTTPIATVAADTFNGLVGLKTLSLNGRNITKLQSYAFNNTGAIETLDLGNNPNLNISSFAFFGCSKITNLGLGGTTNFSTLFVDALSGLSALETFNVSGKNLKTVQANAFRGSGILKTIDMSNNPGLSIAANSFTDCSLVNSLSFNGTTTIATLLTDTFQGLSSLQYLNLNQKLLTSIQTNAFRGMQLVTLDIGNNPTLSIQSNAFQTDCSGLTGLTFGGTTTFPTLTTDMFNGLPSASYPTMDLSGKSITQIQANAFRGLDVRNLSLDNNPTLNISTDAMLNGLPNLSTFTFGGTTTLPTLNTGAFNGIPAATFTDLNFTGKAITTIQANAFIGLTLNSLNFNNNPNLVISSSAFASGCGALTSLTFLGTTTLPVLNTDAFLGIPQANFQNLNLNSKSIRTINADAFRGLNLSTLNLGGQGALTINAFAFRSGAPTMGTDPAALNLTGCQLGILQTDALNGLPFTTLFLNSLSITLIQSNAFRGMEGLTTLTLNSNTGLNISANAFSGLTQVTNLTFTSSTMPGALVTNAFAGLSALPLLDLSTMSSITTINNLAFNGMTSLQTLKIGATYDNQGLCL